MAPENNEIKDVASGENVPKPVPAKYKFRDIKVHASDEWMADGTKKYRQVYDRYETTHMRVEFSFFNKLFDEDEWEASITIKCFVGTRELCNLPQKRKITKDENIVYIRESWGNPTPGAYWLKGNYVWEAFIDDVKVGSAKFYVEDAGVAKNGENLFFDLESIKMHEGDNQAYALPQKKYMKRFSRKDSRYIWGDVRIKNKLATDYYAEVFFNFCDDAGQLKGRSTRLIYIPVNTAGTSYILDPSWGSETPGSWKDESYTLEVVFMDRLIAIASFGVGDAFEEGDVAVNTDTKTMLSQIASPNSSSNKSLDDILFESLAELNSLTGLEGIKAEVNEMVKLVRYYQESGKDILNRFSLHTVFTGNPGTGKTTVARIMAKIYKGLGVLEKGHLVEVDRQGLVAGFVGQTAIKTGEKVDEAMGGILFVDEAYSLANESGTQHDFGGESIQVILKRMEDLRGKFGVIVAGYTDNMQEFINSNPGLRSRFDKYFLFEDYTVQDMMTIAAGLFKKEGVTPEKAAEDHLRDYFTYLHEGRDKHFGNARTVRQVVGESVKNQNLRLASMKKEERTKEMTDAIIHDDVKEFVIGEVKSRGTSLGFQIGKK